MVRLSRHSGRSAVTKHYYVAWVQRAGASTLMIAPCDQSIPDRRVRRDEVQAVYRLVGRPSLAATGRLRPSPRQLRLDDDLNR